MQVSSSDHCERRILFTVSIFARVRSMKSVSLAMLKAEKVGVFQTPQTLCEEDSLVADAAVSRLLPVPSENDPSIEQILPCWKNKHVPWFNVLRVFAINEPFMRQASSYRSPVPNREHTCRCQAVPKLFSSQFLFSE